MGTLGWRPSRRGWVTPRELRFCPRALPIARARGPSRLTSEPPRPRSSTASWGARDLPHSLAGVKTLAPSAQAPAPPRPVISTARCPRLEARGQSCGPGEAETGAAGGAETVRPAHPASRPPLDRGGRVSAPGRRCGRRARTASQAQAAVRSLCGRWARWTPSGDPVHTPPVQKRRKEGISGPQSGRRSSTAWGLVPALSPCPAGGVHTQHTRVFTRKEAIPGLSLHCSPHPHLSSAAGSSPLTVTPSSTRRAELRLRDLDSYVWLQNPSASACAHRQACACPETLGSVGVRTTEGPALPCPRCPERTRWNRHQKQGQLQAGRRGRVSPQPEEEGLVLGSPPPPGSAQTAGYGGTC